MPSNEEIPNPFDMLGNTKNKPSEQKPQAPIIDPAPAPPTQIVPAQPVLKTDLPQAEITADPTRLPVRTNAPVVDTMATYGHIAGVPDATATQVDWCYGTAQTPNPVAEVLLRQECVEGLWDGYDAMRAEECALMWSRLTAQKKCRGCSKCRPDCTTNRYQTCDNGCQQCDK